MRTRCVHARIPPTRSASTSGKLVARLSSNFYSLLGTEDEKTAQTESPRSFLSRYTCSFPSLHLLNFLVHHPLTLSSFVPSTPYPSPFPFDQRCSPQVTDSTLPLPLVSTMLHSLTFYLLIDESRVNPIGSGPPPLDKISLIRSRPSKVFLPPFPSASNHFYSKLCASWEIFWLPPRMPVLFRFSLFFFFPPQVLPSSLSYLFFFSWATLLTLRFLRFRSLVYTFFEVSPPPIEWSSRVRPPPPPWIIFSCSSFFVLVVRSLWQELRQVYHGRRKI